MPRLCISFDKPLCPVDLRFCFRALIATVEDLIIRTAECQFVTDSVAIVCSTNEVMFELRSISVVELIISVHASVASFVVGKAIRVLCVHAVVGVTVTHLLGEVPTELTLLKGSIS